MRPFAQVELSQTLTANQRFNIPQNLSRQQTFERRSLCLRTRADAIGNANVRPLSVTTSANKA
jgi:hypothetical protein